MNKNSSERSSSSRNRIKPIVMANGKQRCPNGTRRKGKYCVGAKKDNTKFPTLPSPVSPDRQGGQPVSKTIPPDGRALVSPRREAERQPVSPDRQRGQPRPPVGDYNDLDYDNVLKNPEIPNKRIRIRVPKQTEKVPDYKVENEEDRTQKVVLPEPPPNKRIKIRVPKQTEKVPEQGEQPLSNTIPPDGRALVKPIEMANGKKRCPDGTRRSKDGHWCIPKKYQDVPYIREIIDEVAKKSKSESKQKSPPHAIIMDKEQTPVALDTRPADMEEDTALLEIPSVTPIHDPSLMNTVPSAQEQVPSAQEQVPSAQEQVPSAQEQVPSLQEQIPSLQEQIPSVQEQPSAPEEESIVDTLISTRSEAERQPLVNRSKTPSETSTTSNIPSTIEHKDTNTNMDVTAKQLNLLKREKERAENANPVDLPFLLPTLNDPRFAERIARHKAFADTPYDGTTHEIEKRANEMCQVEFGLMPHQSFVRNFMSAETPYNTLLLYHSLGSGKTCSAISVCEEMRDYMKQSGLREKIIVIASPNVQGNFRKQLFDESRLEKIVLNTDPEEYTWNIQSCVGNSLLREINPAQIRNYPKEKIISNIQSLISTYYSFMGYGQFANYVLELTGASSQYEIANIRRHFNNRLIVIDEVQNIRMTEENTNKEATAAAAVLLKVVKHATNLRLLLLTATPMYNSYKEIVWLTNLMNSNDGRSTIEVKDIFDADGNIKTDKSGENGETGLELLRRKLTGYVSYVRGENPYAFPFRIYPEVFAPDRALSSMTAYPTTQMNGKEITEPMTKMPVYLNRLSRTSQQFMVYDSIINELAIGKDVYTATGKLKKQLAFDDMDAFGYTTLQHPIEALNIAYPDPTGTKVGLVGSAGLQTVVTYDRATKTDFEYLPGTNGRIFSPELIENYSAKIAEIGRCIRDSEGIVIVYSQYIEGGIVPLALAMEEMGVSRYASTPSTRSLFKPSNAPNVPPLLTAAGKPAKYIMITGDRQYSPANNADMKVVSSGENKDGDLIKVVLISRAGAEGLDFANVRQLHIMEPWYNMSRMEQIIGRAVRNLSHCRLPFNKRNVQIFLHGTIIDAENAPKVASPLRSEDLSKTTGSLRPDLPSPDQGGRSSEAADMYVYRLVEKKMHLIQNVERVMKEMSVDCMIHIGQNNYTKSALSKEPKNVNIPIILSNGKTIEFTPGDEDDTVYECKSTSGDTLTAVEPTEEGKTTYSDVMARTNIQYISDRIRQLFRDSHAWSRNQLVKAINVKKQVPIEQVFYTLSRFVGNKHNYVIDRYGRFGYIVNNDQFYTFQPMELTDTKLSMFERSVPVEYKRHHVSLEVSPEFGKAPIATAEQSTQRQTQTLNQGQVEAVENASLQTLEDLFIAATDKNEVKKSKDWYIHAGHVFEHLQQVHFIPIEAQHNYFAHHFFDLMDSGEKQSLVKYLFPENSAINKNDLATRAGRSYRVAESSMRDRALTYFAKRMLFNARRNDVLCLVVNKTSLVIMKRGVAAGSEWKIGDRADLDYFVPEVESRIHVNKHQLFPVIGFSGDFKGKEMVFKVKDLSQTRNNVGAKCESAGKVDIIKYANQLLGHEQYTQENTDTAKQGGITQLGMCVILEFLMRDFTEQKRAGKVYYLGPEQAVEIDITHI